jgi:hypothetical protein
MDLDFSIEKQAMKGKLRKILCSMSLEKQKNKKGMRRKARNFAMQINDNFISL